MSSCVRAALGPGGDGRPVGTGRLGPGHQNLRRHFAFDGRRSRFARLNLGAVIGSRHACGIGGIARRGAGIGNGFGHRVASSIGNPRL
jgi:hypothetical protein